MNEGWLELESDPGLFTLLVEEFGVKGVQVEEIYDLQKPIEGPVFGFIFLFKWIEERRARRKMSPTDEAFVQDVDVVNNMFFAQQIVPNSCATHALLSVLLNCSDINLGHILTGLKTFTNSFTPESKGYAIGNVAQIAKVHNSHAHPEPRRVKEKQSLGLITTTSRNHEAFHFVSYVPINGRLFELDGLKPYPIDHGPWGDHEEWTEKFRRVIAERLENEGGSSDIRFNLMAVVADRRMAYEHRLSTLKNNKHVILDALEQLMCVNRPRVSHHHHHHDKNQPEATKTEDENSSTLSHDQPVKKEEDSAPGHQAVKEEERSITAAVLEEKKPLAEMESIPPRAREEKPSVKCEETDSGRQKVGEERMEVDGREAVAAVSQKQVQTIRKKKKAPKVKIKTFPMPQQTYRLPAALDSHNYAKSPLESADEGGDDSSSELFTEDSDTEETSDADDTTTTSTSTSDSSSDDADTDSESVSTEDNKTTEEESDAVEDNRNAATKATVAAEADVPSATTEKPRTSVQPEKQQASKETTSSSASSSAVTMETDDKTFSQDSDATTPKDVPPPPATDVLPPSLKTEGGILKKQGATTVVEKSDSPALRVTFSDAHEEKQVEGAGGRDEEVEGSRCKDDIEDVDIEILDATIPADITKPLTIQTVFENGNGPPSPASSNYSTDTASDAGSAFNSPIRSVVQSRSGSPNSAKQLKFKEWKTNVITEARAKLEATIMELDQKESAAKKTPSAGAPGAPKAGAHMGTRSKVARASAAASPHQTRQATAKRLADQTGSGSKRHASSEDSMTGAAGGSRSVLFEVPDDWDPPRPSFLVSQNGKQPFAPRDLLELLKSVESEIEVYDQKLLDETEKRHKYKIDDCRRTHNYDPFICTFLTMLAEQGKLSALVEKHTTIKRRQGISLGHLQKSRKRDRRRARSRPKKTKLK